MQLDSCECHIQDGVQLDSCECQIQYEDLLDSCGTYKVYVSGTYKATTYVESCRRSGQDKFEDTKQVGPR